jgi:hypothetical protein
MIAVLQRPGMIVDVSLRLYLIFNRLLGWLLLLAVERDFVRISVGPQAAPCGVA